MKTVFIDIKIHPKQEAFVAYELTYKNPENRTFKEVGGWKILDQTVSRQQLALMAVRSTLKKLNQPCKVYITINSHYVWLNALRLARRVRTAQLQPRCAACRLH